MRDEGGEGQESWVLIGVGCGPRDVLCWVHRVEENAITPLQHHHVRRRALLKY